MKCIFFDATGDWDYDYNRRHDAPIVAIAFFG